jgi:hypothetical protein
MGQPRHQILGLIKYHKKSYLRSSRSNRPIFLEPHTRHFLGNFCSVSRTSTRSGVSLFDQTTSKEPSPDGKRGRDSGSCHRGRDPQIHRPDAREVRVRAIVLPTMSANRAASGYAVHRELRREVAGVNPACRPSGSPDREPSTGIVDPCGAFLWRW